MDITKCRIDMVVRAEDGRTGKIVSLFSDGEVRVNFAPGRDIYKLERASDLTPVSDPCEGCQKLVDRAGELCTKDAVISGLRSRVEKLCTERDNWIETAKRHCRNESYYREELTKLQNEALAESPKLYRHKIDMMTGVDEMAPIGMIAKCYKQVEPEQLLMSQEARRVVEYLTAMNYPAYIGNLLEGMKDIMSGMALIDGLIEAREAGRISLVDGKYEIVRD